MELMTAAEKLLVILKETKCQYEREALELGIEALRRQAGYPPGLPGYVTIFHGSKLGAAGLAELVKAHKGDYHSAAIYMSRKALDWLQALVVSGEALVTYTPRNCYEDKQPNVCGLPVIVGREEDLKDEVYFVARIER